MHRLLNFFRRYYVLMLFLLLQSAAISYYARSSSYTKARIITLASTLTGDVNYAIGGVGDYFSLDKTNKKLTGRIAELENELTAYRAFFADTLGDESREALELYAADLPYRYFTARVVGNSITGQNNYFVINKGRNDGIEPNMAVMTVNGDVAGYVESCTGNLAVCMSVINTDFKLGGQIKGKDFFGSIRWNGDNHHKVTLTEMPRYADVQIGDSVVSVHSQRFPPESFIGTVSAVGYSEDNSFFQIEVALGADMARLKDVLVVRYKDSDELEQLLDGQEISAGQTER